MEEKTLSEKIKEFTVAITDTLTLLHAGLDNLRDEVRELTEYIELIKSNQLTREEVVQIVLETLNKNL